MNAARRVEAAGGVLLIALVLSTGCDGPEGMWRDQYIFVGDGGTVMPLGVLRWSTGHAEVKGWLGHDGSWRTVFHQRFPILGRRAADAERTLLTFSGAPGAPARVALKRDGSGEELTIRTPDREMTLTAPSMGRLGHARDPEGVSEYRAGRARLIDSEIGAEGWLIVETTPADAPRKAYVDYGDFAFVALADAERVLVLKTSRGQRGFDQAWLREDERVRTGTSPRVEPDGEELRVRLGEPELNLSLRIADRSVSRGVAPTSETIRYETLLLAGDYAGVAFIIRPVVED